MPAERWQQLIYLSSTFPKVSVICLAGSLSLSLLLYYMYFSIVFKFILVPLQQHPASVSYRCKHCHLNRESSAVVLYVSHRELFEVKCNENGDVRVTCVSFFTDFAHDPAILRI